MDDKLIPQQVIQLLELAINHKWLLIQEHKRYHNLS